MSGYSEMLLQSAREHKQKVGLEEIKKAAARAAGLTRRLLSFSRRELRNDQAVNLNRVLQEMRLMLERLLGENVRLITRCADDLWPVDLEEGQVEQIIANLVVNARDAMPRGGTITLTTENRSLDPEFCRKRPPLQPGAHVMVTVRDTGEGIPAALLPEIFNPFFTTKEEGKGTGLGLATVSSIIQRAGGYIEVESSPGKGATFRIHLPRSTAQTADKVQLLENPPLPRGRENILLVEDDNGLRRLTREILEDQGYRVFPAACGLEALKLFRRAREIDLVLSDVVLPNLGGRELAEKLRRQNPRLPILLMSGYAPPPRLEDQQGNPFPCLQKPFPPLILARKVRELLDGNT
jgi:CheY-like chemotaxis protein